MNDRVFFNQIMRKLGTHYELELNIRERQFSYAVIDINGGDADVVMEFRYRKRTNDYKVWVNEKILPLYLKETLEGKVDIHATTPKYNYQVVCKNITDWSMVLEHAIQYYKEVM